MESKEQSSVVTKAKHPGRVTQGQKLADLMKERKQELLKNKDSVVNSSTDSSTDSSTGKTLASQGCEMTKFGLYGGIMFLITGGIYYFYTHRKAPLQTPVEKKQPKKYME